MLIQDHSYAARTLSTHTYMHMYQTNLLGVWNEVVIIFVTLIFFFGACACLRACVFVNVRTRAHMRVCTSVDTGEPARGDQADAAVR